jgi:crotonobetainyl-CoA:carnitine CoA-transferase CaiB-like acyl-CoA transferase
VLGIETIENDPRFATDDARNANGEALIPILEQTFIKRTFAEWLPVLESLDIPWELISSIEDVTNDPQVHANGIMRKMAVGDTEVSIVAGPASWDGAQFSAEPKSSPVLGADTWALLAEVGYSADAIADMQSRAVAN